MYVHRSHHPITCMEKETCSPTSPASQLQYTYGTWADGYPKVHTHTPLTYIVPGFRWRLQVLCWYFYSWSTQLNTHKTQTTCYWTHRLHIPWPYWRQPFWLSCPSLPSQTWSRTSAQNTPEKEHIQGGVESAIHRPYPKCSNSIPLLTVSIRWPKIWLSRSYSRLWDLTHKCDECEAWRERVEGTEESKRKYNHCLSIAYAQCNNPCNFGFSNWGPVVYHPFDKTRYTLFFLANTISCLIGSVQSMWLLLRLPYTRRHVACDSN